jgi:hypothetical protein
MPHRDNASNSSEHPDPVFDLADFDGYDERQFASEPLIDDDDPVVPPPVTGAPPTVTAQNESATAPGDGSAG